MERIFQSIYCHPYKKYEGGKKVSLGTDDHKGETVILDGLACYTNLSTLHMTPFSLYDRICLLLMTDY